MASSPSGVVTQNNLSGTELLYTDTGSYGTITSRTLTVYDYQNNLIHTYAMGIVLTQVVPVASDGWYKFVCTVTDNISGSPWVATTYFVAAGYYIAAYLAKYTSTSCGCMIYNCNIEAAENAYNAALRYNLAGQAGAALAQLRITDANIFINMD